MGMASDPGTFEGVLTAQVIAAIEQRLKHLGSPTVTPAEVCWGLCKYMPAAFVSSRILSVQVSANKTKASCYIRLLDYVFDVTTFLKRHPGGELLLLQQAGDKDRAKIFASVHSPKAAEMLPELLVGTISAGVARGTASMVLPRTTEPSSSLKTLARQDSQGSVLGESCSNMEALDALEVFETEVKTRLAESLGANAAANAELQDDGQSTQEGAAHCEEVKVKCREEAERETRRNVTSKIAQSGHGTGTGQGEIHSAAAIEYPKGVPFEPEATAESIDPTRSSATRTMQAPAGGTLDAKTVSRKAGHTAEGSESKCPFAAILKAAGHDITGMSMPANHQSAHVRSPKGSPLDPSSPTEFFKEKTPWRDFGVMQELQAVPETRPMVVDSCGEGETELELESGGLSPLRGSTSQRSLGNFRRCSPAGSSQSMLQYAGSSKSMLQYAGSSKSSHKEVFKFSLHEAASQSSRHSSTTSKGTGSKGTGSKHSGGGRAGARKRRQRVARARGNKVDMDEWNRRVVTIKDFWNNLFKTVSMTRLGTSLLDTVETDDTLEPLFRCISALCVCLCVSCSIRLKPTTPSSPSSGVYLFSALQCVHVFCRS